MNLEEIKKLFLNYPIKDVVFGSGSVKFVLNGGYEVHLNGNYDDLEDMAELEIDVYKTEIRRVGEKTI